MSKKKWDGMANTPDRASKRATVGQAARKSERQGYLLVVVAAAIWGTIGPFIKVLDGMGASSLLISFLRMAFAFLIMAVLTVFLRGAKSLRLHGKPLLACFLLGFLSQGVYNLLYAVCVAQAGVAVGAVLLNLSPVFTFIFSAIVFGEKATRTKLLAIAINVVGCALVATGGRLDVEQLAWFGILCGVGAGILYALTPIFSRMLLGTDNLVVSTWSYLFAALTLLPALPLSGEGFGGITWGIVGVEFLFALIPTAIAYLIYYRGVQMVSETSKVPVFASSETLVACILGVILYHESLGAASLVGIALVLISVVLMSRKPRDAAD